MILDVMILDVLKYILVVLGIVAVGAFIVWGLVSLILLIIEPHGNGEQNNNNTNNYYDNSRITYQNYEPQRLIANDYQKQEPVAEQKDVQDVDLDKARAEEEALSQGTNFDELEQEEDLFIKEKQRKIEERLAEKAAKEEEQDEINIDDIFVDDEEEKEEPAAETEEPEVEENEDDEDIEDLINKILDEDETEEEPAEEPAEEVVEEEQVEAPAEIEEDEADKRIKELEEALARQKEEYENRLKQAEAEKDTEANERIAELEKQLAEKETTSAPALSLEEYEARLEVLRERLKANEKELKVVKKDFIPLYKIHKTLERDNVKLRRKEALVAKQKVVLYGVNNYVDIDEDKAKKLAEDLDLLEGLRLSVQHCEEVMKANEERYPVLETAYKTLVATNEDIKADIKDCTDKIEEIKANNDTDAE